MTRTPITRTPTTRTPPTMTPTTRTLPTGARTARPPGRWATVALTASVALSVLAGCTGATGTRAGGEPPPTTLRIGTDDPPGRPGSDQIEEFARQVAERSDGRLLIEPVFRAAGEGNLAWDQRVARMVMDGQLDLGMIPARAWDTEGVDTLRALHAPFLVADDEHAKAIVTDDDLADDLMRGLADVGITGLALLPEGMRHYFSFDSRPVTLAGFEGARVRSPRSETTWAVFEALGARPTDAFPDASMDGVESGFALAATFPEANSTVGNLVFFPKVNSLVVNSDRFAELEEDHRSTLREAALAARDTAVSTLRDHATLAAEYCEAGGTVVLADERELAAIRDAAGPVIEELRRDQDTASLMDRIAASGEATEGSGVAACSGAAAGGTVTSETITPVGGGLPDGTYRVEFTDGYLENHGLVPEMVALNRGVWTIELRAGEWSVHQVSPDVEERFTGVYQVKGPDMYVRFPEGELVHVRWSANADGDLSFEYLAGPADAMFHFDRPWRKVG